MKKIIASVCTFALVIAMPATAFAAPSLPATGTNDDVTLNTTAGQDDQDVPVYGYIGEDANITDPDPTDPTEPPVVTPTGTDMVLSVPVKLMWAAFASGAGSVVSPDYEIENKSAFGIDVEMTSFTLTNSVATPGLTLNLEGAATNGMTTINDVLNAANHNAAFGTLDAAGGTVDTRGFSIGGTYTGAYGTALQPEYSMVLTFAIH